MVCRKCGANIEAGYHFCGECGAKARGEDILLSWAIRQKDWVIAALGISLLLIFIMRAPSPSSLFRGGSTPETGAAQNTPAVNSTAPVVANSGSQAIHMNETVDLGEWSYEVTSIQWADSVNSEHEVETADRKFLLVQMVIRNNDRVESELPPMRVIGPEGKFYQPSPKGNFVQDSFGAGKIIGPRATAFGTVVFDVPEGAYRLIVSERLGPTRTTTIELQ